MDSFTAAILPELPRLRIIARRCNGSDADDLVQETVARALRFRAGFRAGSDLRAWLTRILVNLHAGQRRRDYRWARAQARYVDEPRPQRGDPSTIAELDALCARLPAAELDLVARAEVLGESYIELASSMSIPLGTVMSRLFRARRRLRNVVQRRSDVSTSTVSAPATTPSSRAMPRSSTATTSTRPSARPTRAAAVRAAVGASSTMRRNR